MNLVCENIEGSGEIVPLHELLWAFAFRICDKYQNLWLVQIYMRDERCNTVLVFYWINLISHSGYIQPGNHQVSISFQWSI